MLPRRRFVLIVAIYVVLISVGLLFLGLATGCSILLSLGR